MAKVLALVHRDARDGTVDRSATALLTLARRLGEPVAVLGGGPAPAGQPDDAAIDTLGEYGATEIWCLPAAAPPGATLPLADASPSAGALPAAGPLPAAALSTADALALADAPRSADASPPSAALPSDVDLLAHLATTLHPAAILIPATYRGQETAARLAVRLDAGIITDAVDVLPGPDGPVALQRCLAGAYLVESSVIRGVPIITVRPEAAVPEPHPAAPALRFAAVEPTSAPVPRIVTTPRLRPDHPALDHADVVVAGGRGIGSRAAFAVLAEVAEALGGAVAGSHTAAELGWVPREARVGLTGKTVQPRLYLACGVSGSVRHRAGMQGAKAVVVIGDDPAAPIFRMADLGVVGDVRAILPALLAEIRARRKSRARKAQDDR